MGGGGWVPLGWLVGWWALFGVSHSLLAALWLKDWVKEQSTFLYVRFRLLYNLIALLALLGLVLQLSHMQAPLLWQPPVWVFALLCLTGGCGLAVMLLCFRHYSAREFLGLERFGKVQTGSLLVTTGMNAWVRHPLYFGTTLLVVALCLGQPSAGNLLSLCFYCVYLVIGTRLEEQKLVNVFGDAYVAYKKRVPMLVPFRMVLKGT
jgi:protein-S-isoprenylcysteine O-methyltransferase Ste14